MKRSKVERKREGRRDGDLMDKFIETGKISCGYEKRRKQAEILSEMNKNHKGTGVKTIDEHGLEYK